MKNDYQHLAAMAVFRNLYDERKDVYNLIWNFIVKEIKERSLKCFNLNEIVEYVNETNDFVLPRAVIKTALHKNRNAIIKSGNEGNYILKKEFDYLTDGLLNQEETSREKDEINSKVIIPLIEYIEEQKKCVLSEDDKEIILKSLTQYLSSDVCEQYTDYISQFVILNESNDVISQNLRKIKEGIILYEGICYCGKEEELFKAWNTDMDLFLDTDIIFSMMGYNGEIFQQQFNELYKYIKDININLKQKKSNKRINMYYFKEVEEEIIWYFKKAECIVENKEQLNPAQTAMKKIVNGYNNVSEINSQKITLFNKLNSMHIECYCSDFYSQEKYESNKIDIKLITDAKLLLPSSDDLEKHITKINYINILRNNKNNVKFEDARYFALTANGTVFQVAKKFFKDDGNISLVVSYDELINRFWFKSNRGLGANEFPTSLDIVCKARKAISASESSKIRKSYDELKRQYKDGKISKEIADAEYIDMRSRCILPEDVTADMLNDLYIPVSQKDMEKYIDYKEEQKRHLNEKEKIIDNLRYLSNVKDIEIEELRKNNNKYNELIKKNQENEKKKKIRKSKIVSCIKYAFFIICVIACGLLFFMQQKMFAQFILILPCGQILLSIYKKYIKPPHKQLIDENDF